MTTPPYPARGADPWDTALKQYIDSVAGGGGGGRAIFGSQLILGSVVSLGTGSVNVLAFGDERAVGTNGWFTRSAALLASENPTIPVSVSVWNPSTEGYGAPTQLNPDAPAPDGPFDPSISFHVVAHAGVTREYIEQNAESIVSVRPDVVAQCANVTQGVQPGWEAVRDIEAVYYSVMDKASWLGPDMPLFSMLVTLPTQFEGSAISADDVKANESRASYIRAMGAYMSAPVVDLFGAFWTRPDKGRSYIASDGVSLTPAGANAAARVFVDGINAGRF